MSSTPLIDSSSGEATVSAITFGFAPDIEHVPPQMAEQLLDIQKSVTGIPKADRE